MEPSATGADPKEEMQRHLRHGVMFNDGDKRVECLCGWTADYDEAGTYGFESQTRMPRKKQSVLDAFDTLKL